jgi:hypothetical protein
MFGEPELSSDTSISRFARCLYLSPIMRRRALPAVPGNWLPGNDGIQDIEACRRHSRFCHYGVDRLEDTGAISEFHAHRSSQHRAKQGHVAALR